MRSESMGEVLRQPLVMAQFFNKPKCKPWDLIKGKRHSCCHGLIEEGHTRWCIEGLKGKTLTIPKIGRLDAYNQMKYLNRGGVHALET